MQGGPLTSSGLVPWLAESCRLWPHLWLPCSGTIRGSALPHSGVRWPRLQPEPHPCHLSRRGDGAGLTKDTNHAHPQSTGPATQHPQGSQLTHPTRSKALTFCSGPTREAYFLASNLLCCFMQISTKGLQRKRVEGGDKAEPSRHLSYEQKPIGQTIPVYLHTL